MDSKFSIKVIGRVGTAGEIKKTQLKLEDKVFTVSLVGPIDSDYIYIPSEYISEL